MYLVCSATVGCKTGGLSGVLEDLCTEIQLCLYVQFKVQLDVPFMRILYSTFFSYLYMFRVLFALILRSTTAAYSHRCVYGFGMLLHWSKYWLGHPYPHTQLVSASMK
jgi:hypothetical protein